MSPYMTGYHAARDGAGYEDNPHARDTEAYAWWDNGWCDYHKDKENNMTTRRYRASEGSSL